MAFRRAIKQVWGAIWERTWASVLFCGLTALGALFAIGFLGIRFFPGFLKHYNQYFPDIAAGVSAIVVACLVGATIVYARASMKMAEVMKKQLMAARPFVIPDIDVHGNQKTYVENMRDLAQSYFPVAITNVGAATAIELELFLIAPKGNPISTKLPLLLQGGSWRNKLTYVYEFNENGEPIFDMPPPEGRYELKVKFRSAVAEEDMQFSEVTLPFDLQWSGTDFYWKIERHKLNYTSLELKPK